jgi:hypothetical protein
MPRKSLAAIEFPNRSERKSHDFSKAVGLRPATSIKTSQHRRRLRKVPPRQ